MADLIGDLLDAMTAFASGHIATVAGTLVRYGAEGQGQAVERVRKDLCDEIARLREQYATLTVAEYAKLTHMAPSTVKRWIERGELDADRTATGYRIRRTAERTKPRGT